MNEKEEIESSQPSGQSQKKVSLQAGTSKPMRLPVAVLGFAATDRWYPMVTQSTFEYPARSL
ncbi:uncharacterized protein N7496_007726 [Penicillium cataractarum]|uniref:Uncharacterized protein n=1 Tax=Penicillium cataractarum TaxID=2100454 RepID=A0A9W9RX34_9EURO|nr:uncharacterized protein N7496_007726 [Penicillium cataractarum]KAJ5367966.1 hypothetical protein N7496_007726 [Penicillium cataractarum]